MLTKVNFCHNSQVVKNPIVIFNSEAIARSIRRARPDKITSDVFWPRHRRRYFNMHWHPSSYCVVWQPRPNANNEEIGDVCIDEAGSLIILGRCGLEVFLIVSFCDIVEAGATTRGYNGKSVCVWVNE
jgi:hypothetical protein